MGMQFEDKDLISYLLKFVRGMPIECNHIRHIDLYGGNKKPSELFQDLLCSDQGKEQLNYFFTQLKKKSVNGKNINRTIVGCGSWKGRDTAKTITDKKGSAIGLKKTFRFDEESSGSDNKRTVYWIMKEYCLNETIVKALRQCGEIRNEDSVLCSIMRKVSLCKNSQDIPSKIEKAVVPDHRLDNVPCSSKWPLYSAETWQLPPLDGPFESLTEEQLALFEKPDPGYPEAYENKELE